MSRVLEVEGLRARYGMARILDGVTFDVEEGEVFAILGRNGAGKTTTMLSMFGIPEVDGGSVAVDGVRLKMDRPHRAAKAGIAIAPQGRRILGNITIRENLLLGAAVGRAGPWNLQTVGELFPILAERSHTKGTALSGGQLQMLCIGRALMSNPRVLLLDEPTEGLSPVLIDDIAATLPKISDAGTSVVLVEQHLTLVRRVAHRYAILDKGATRATGHMAELDESAARELLGV